MRHGRAAKRIVARVPLLRGGDAGSSVDRCAGTGSSPAPVAGCLDRLVPADFLPGSGRVPVFSGPGASAAAVGGIAFPAPEAERCFCPDAVGDVRVCAPAGRHLPRPLAWLPVAAEPLPAGVPVVGWPDGDDDGVVVCLRIPAGRSVVSCPGYPTICTPASPLGTRDAMPLWSLLDRVFGGVFIRRLTGTLCSGSVTYFHVHADGLRTSCS